MSYPSPLNDSTQRSSCDAKSKVMCWPGCQAVRSGPVTPLLSWMRQSLKVDWEMVGVMTLRFSRVAVAMTAVPTSEAPGSCPLTRRRTGGRTRSVAYKTSPVSKSGITMPRQGSSCRSPNSDRVDCPSTPDRPVSRRHCPASHSEILARTPAARRGYWYALKISSHGCAYSM